MSKYVRSQLQDEEADGDITAAASSISTPPVVVFPHGVHARSAARNLCRGRSLQEKILFYSCLILMFSTFLLAILLYCARCPAVHHQTMPPYLVINITQEVESAITCNKTQPVYCMKPSCVATAARILQNMNPKMSPCEDFYEFACGSFKHHNTIPAGRSSFSAFSQRDILNNIAMRSILEETTNITKLRTDKLSVVLYKACMNVKDRQIKGVQPMLNLLNVSGPWGPLHKNFNAATYDVYNHIKKLDADFMGVVNHAYFGIDVNVDNYNSSRFVFSLSQPDLCLGPDNYRKNRTTNLEALSIALFGLSQLFGFNISKSDIHAVIEFETQIAHILVPEETQRNTSNKLNATFSFLTDDLNCSKFHWLDMLKERLRQTKVSYNLDTSSPLNVQDHTYFPKMCALINTKMQTANGKRLLNTHILFRSFVYLLPYLTVDIENILQQLSATIDGVTGDQPPWQRCVNTVSKLYGFPLGSLFVRALFDQKAKQVATKMVGDVRAAFRLGLDSLAWMDSSTLTAAKTKIDAIKPFVGYPTNILNETYLLERYGGVEFSDDTYFMNAKKILQLETKYSLKQLDGPVKHEMTMMPQAINAYYQPSANVIAFTAAILQEPFFDADLPLAVSYGGIGAVIGHEITHGFDDEGREYDSVGNLRSWWSEDTAREFGKRASCIRSQYEKYRVEGVGIKGSLVLGESIADCGGLKAAYEAYKALDLKTSVNLPGVNFTSDELFFISYAQTWCELKTPEKRREVADSDPHPPGQMRVWGPISNLDQFGLAFNCPKNSAMNPDSRCVVW